MLKQFHAFVVMWHFFSFSSQGFPAILTKPNVAIIINSGIIKVTVPIKIKISVLLKKGFTYVVYRVISLKHIVKRNNFNNCLDNEFSETPKQDFSILYSKLFLIFFLDMY